MHNAIAKSPLNEKEFVVYRGQTYTPKKNIYHGEKYDDKGRVKLDEIYALKGMYSTDILASNAINFTDINFRHLLKIIIPRDLPCLNLVLLSKFGMENEVLLSHDSKFRVVEEPTVIFNTERTTFEYIEFKDMTSAPIAKTKTLVEDIGIPSQLVKYNKAKLETRTGDPLIIMNPKIKKAVYTYISGTNIKHGQFYSEVVDDNKEIQEKGEFKMGNIISLTSYKKIIYIKVFIIKMEKEILHCIDQC